MGSRRAGDLLLVEDVRLVRQTCDWASVAFDDAAVADFFDEQVDAGRQPEEFGRIWVHTHPGDSAGPSLTDEETFARVFGGCDWAVMLILARAARRYARLRVRRRARRERRDPRRGRLRRGVLGDATGRLAGGVRRLRRGRATPVAAARRMLAAIARLAGTTTGWLDDAWWCDRLTAFAEERAMTTDW